MPEPGVGFSILERLEALVANPALFELADAEPDPSAGGRPRDFPVFMWLLFDALLSVYGSAARSNRNSHTRPCGEGSVDMFVTRCRTGPSCG